MKQTKNSKLCPKKTEKVKKNNFKSIEQIVSKKNVKAKSAKVRNNVFSKTTDKQRNDSSSETTICGSPKPTRKLVTKSATLSKEKKPPTKRPVKDKSKEPTNASASKIKTTKQSQNNKKSSQNVDSKNSKKQIFPKSSSKDEDIKKSKNNTRTKPPKSKTVVKKPVKRRLTKEPQQLMAMFEKDDLRPRGPRLASLNASCKMQLLYECEKYQPFVSDNSSNSDTDEQTESGSESDSSELVSKSTDLKNKSIKSNSNLASIKKTENEQLDDNDLLTDDESDYQSVCSSSKKTHDDSQETIEEDTEKSDNEEENELEHEAKKKLSKKRSISSLSSSSSTLSKNYSSRSTAANSKKSIKNGKSEVCIQTNKSLKGRKSVKKPTLKERKQEKTKEAKQNNVKKSAPRNTDKSDSDKPKRGRKPKAKDNSAKTPRKRKLIDDSVELIDTRSSKRMASLNASAIMTASLQKEKSMAVAVRPTPIIVPKPECRPENLHADSVEVIQKTKTTTVINNEVTQTIETIKQVRQVSSKLRDRALSIEMLDSSHSNHGTEHIEHIDTGIVEEPVSDDDVMSPVSNLPSSKHKFSKKLNGGIATNNGNSSKSKSKNYVNKFDESGSSRKEEPGSSQVTSMTSTTTTKVKINKRRSSDKLKTTVEKYQYEVHGAFNPFNASIPSQSVNNLRSAANQPSAPGHQEPASSSMNSSVGHQNVISLGNQPLAAAGYGFTPGYCIYPSYPTQLELAYHAHAAVSQLNSPQQQPSVSTGGSAQQIHYAHHIPGAYSTVQQPLFANHQLAMLNLQEPGRSISGQYKSAFSVPQNATTTSSTTTPTSQSSSSSVPYSSRLNGFYQMSDTSLVQPVNDSYLIHKPVAFNAAAGSQVYTAGQSPTSTTAGTFHFRPQTTTQLGTIIHPQATTQIQAAASPQLLQTAMHYLTQPFLGQSYIFQCPPTGQSLSAATAAGTFSQPIFTNPFLQAGFPTNIEQSAQHNTSSASANQPAAAVNIAFIPGFQHQPGASLHLPTASLDGSPHLLFNSANANPHNFSAVPNLVSTAVVSAGQETAAVKPNSNQPATNISPMEDSSSTISVSLKQMRNQNNKSPKTKLAPRPPTTSISISQVCPKSKNLQKVKKLESKQLFVKKSSKLITKNVSEKQKPMYENGDEVAADCSMQNVVTLSSPSITSCNTHATTKTPSKHVAANSAVSSKSDLSFNSTTSINSLTQKGQINLLNGGKKAVDHEQPSKNKSFAVGIRKNRGIKKSKKLSISGCPIEVNDGSQTATPLGNATIIGGNILSATIASVNRTTAGFQKPFLPGIAPEPEPIGVHQPNSSCNGVSSNNNGWSVLSKSSHLSNNKPVVKKTPITTIYLQQEQPKTKLNNSNLSLTSGNLGILKTPKAATNGHDSIEATATSSSSLTITALGITSLDSSGGGGASASAGESQKQPLRKQAGQMKSRSVAQDSSTAADVVIFRAKNDSNRNESLKSNSSLVTLTVTDSKTEKQLLGTEHVRLSKEILDNKDISLASNHNVDSNAKIVASSKKGTKNSFVKGIDLNRNVSSNSSSPQNKVEPPPPATHGWRWEGEPTKKLVAINPDEPAQFRMCYPRIRHSEGDIISVRDCVLLRSGTRRTDVPFVAKISALWEEPSSKAMMMSLLWYYRPEHTDMITSGNMDTSKPALAYQCEISSCQEEIFASKHRDVNSVACIDDKCYVLTFNEFCRYRKKQKMIACQIEQSLTDRIVPSRPEIASRRRRVPPLHLCNDMVLCCRKVYDFRQKRILKNPL